MTALPLLQPDPDQSFLEEERKGRLWARALVVAVLAICGFLVIGLPRSLHGAGILIVVALALLDVVLVGATNGLAFARARSLDERQIAVRNLAYRRGFRLLGLALVLTVVLWLLGNIIAHATTPPFRFPQVDSGVNGRFIIGVLELVAMMPTLVVAWVEPGPIPGRWATLGPPAVAGSGIVLAWLLTLMVAPAQEAAPSGNMQVGFSSPVAAACHHFVGGRIVGAGFGATVGTHVEVCWDGRRAFVVGAPGGPESGQSFQPMDPMVTACGGDSSGDFAVVSGVTCTTKIRSDGTLHYTFHARVSPLPFGIGAREVSMNLVVTRQGRVLEAF